MFVSMIIHDHVMRLLEMAKEFIPRGLQFTIKHSNAVQFFALVLRVQSF